jgi:hypothetical protein
VLTRISFTVSSSARLTSCDVSFAGSLAPMAFFLLDLLVLIAHFDDPAAILFLQLCERLFVGQPLPCRYLKKSFWYQHLSGLKPATFNRSCRIFFDTAPMLSASPS